MTTRAPPTQEQAIEYWTEYQRRISVGAFEERSAEHYEADTWPEDGVEESVHNLEQWAARQGLEFVWNDANKTWSLEPMQPRSGECAECGRYTSQLSVTGLCEGCIMQAQIDAIQENERTYTHGRTNTR
ncbi:MAG TPA: hypothetical protein VE843_11890 [Ktedonobacteraceae bacterium]|nr:hypothetical protein [Ktedonobacteraceae bacterium]